MSQQQLDYMIARMLREKRRPRGQVRLYLPDGRVGFRGWNLFVNAGLPALAKLLAGVTSGEYALNVGFGSGSTAPALTDTDLTGPFKYYNAVGSNSEDGLGNVTFNFELVAASDYGAYGLTVAEVGLYGNTGSAGIPAAIGTGNPTWIAATVETIGNLIVDSNGNIQRVTALASDDKTGSSAPTWATTLSATTVDNHVTWTLVALHTAPIPMLAHALVPAVAFSGAANYAGTWTFSF